MSNRTAPQPQHPTQAQAIAANLIATVSGVAASLYQVSNPPPTLAALYLEDPSLGHPMVDFGPQLRRITRTFLAGLIG